MSEDRELEELRRKRLEELRAQADMQSDAEAQQKELEARRAMVLRQILTPKARDRLANIKIARPDFAEGLENQLIALAQRSGLQNKITEKQLIEILKRLQPSKRERKIEFKRK